MNMKTQTCSTTRDIEAVLMTRCAAVAMADAHVAQDQKEANVFLAAGMVVQSQFPDESRRLKQASEHYFETHPGDRLPAVDVVRQGWVVSLPRLRDMLTRQLQGH